LSKSQLLKQVDAPLTDPIPPKIACIALGSNQPIGELAPPDVLKTAIDALNTRVGAIRARSDIYQTPCFPEGAGPDFANAVVTLTCDSPAETLLTHLHALEADFGRVRAARWSQRSLDLDLLAVDQEIAPDAATVQAWIDLPLQAQMREAPSDLVLPHPRLQDRAFVLVPLAQIAPDWVHPVLNRSVAEMCDMLPKAVRAKVKRLVKR